MLFDESIILGLVVVLLYLTNAHSQSITTLQSFNYTEQLDPEGNYFMSWAFNDTHIVFEVRVHTTGYVGFGLSPNGDMAPADVVIGWVKDDGTTHFSVSRITFNSSPLQS